MPITIPQIQPNQQGPRQRFPEVQPGPALGVARGLAANADVFQRIAIAADEAELRALKATGKVRLESVLKDTAIEFDDPDEFATNAQERIKTTHDSLIEQAKSSRVRQSLRTELSDDLIRIEQEIKYGALQKRVEIAKANSEIFLEDAERRLMNAPDDVSRTEIETEMAEHLKSMVAVGAIKRDAAVKRAQKIKENDAYNRAFLELRNASDPIGTLERFQRDNPNLDPNRVRNLVERADVEHRRRLAEAEKASKETKEDAVLSAVIDANNGRMTLSQLDDLARRNRFTAEEYNRVKSAIENEGVTDPTVYNSLELEIREGRLQDYRTIQNSKSLDRQAKSQLMGLIMARKDHAISEARSQRAEARALASEGRARHFSNAPEYQEAVKEFRAAISAKGPMESFSDKEQRQYLWGLRQLWDRTEKGESPMTVSREISERARQMKQDGLFADDPIASPRFQTPQELAEAFRSGRIDRKQFDDEALLLEQIMRQQKAQEARKLQRQQGQESGRRR